MGAIPAFMTAAYAAEKTTSSKEQQIVDDARTTWVDFAASPVLKSELHDWMRGAKGLLIVPRIIRGAAGIGAEGGRGVLLVRDEKTGEWSDPAFYTVRHVSFGLQIGGDVSQAVFVVWSRRGLEKFYGSQLKLGFDIGIAAGPMGGGTALEGLTADLFVYTRAKGAFVGTSLKGGRIAVAEKSNQAYYGRPVKPTDIVVEKTVSNPHAQGLRTAVAELIK
jgi:lipid-binding SYLF domain-containing protein